MTKEGEGVSQSAEYVDVAAPTCHLRAEHRSIEEVMSVYAKVFFDRTHTLKVRIIY